LALSKTIEHEGTVVKVIDNTVVVNIVSASACSACHAKGACIAADTKDKIIEVKNPAATYHAGEQVIVILEESAGYKALFLGYVFPFLVLIATLLTVSQLTKSEVMSGLVAVGILIPYYLGLYFYREKVKKDFTFRIKKLK